MGKNYRVGRKIGSGSFGDIYLGTDLINGSEVAIKMESTRRKNPHLLFECKVYRALAGGVGTPMIHWYGVDGEFTVMVMDLLGQSLEDLFTYCGRKFRLKTVLMLADQMIQRIEFVHSKNFIHRDIKPHNFLMGRGRTESMVFIIDFGLAKRYRDSKTHAHIPYREGKSLTGTARYVSLNTHLGLEQSRRDDLESLGYVFLYFVKGQLPWQGLKAMSKRDKYERIMDKKMTTDVQVLCKHLPPEFATYINYCRKLRFADRPDYMYLRRLLKELLFREGFYYDLVFDWSALYAEKGFANYHTYRPPPAVDQSPNNRQQHNNDNNNNNSGLPKTFSADEVPNNEQQRPLSPKRQDMVVTGPTSSRVPARQVLQQVVSTRAPGRKSELRLPSSSIPAVLSQLNVAGSNVIKPDEKISIY